MNNDYTQNVQNIINRVADGGDYRKACNDSGLAIWITTLERTEKLYKTGLFLREELPSLASMKKQDLDVLIDAVSLRAAPISAVDMLIKGKH